MMKLKNAAERGMIAKKIIVVPCIVNIVLYCCAVSTVPLGYINWRRMSSASTPPTKKKNSANTP